MSAVIKPSHDTLELADRMAAILKSVGFVLKYVSMKSEACYYAWPGRHEVVRIATHRFGKNHGRVRDINGQVVVAKITLCGTHPDEAWSDEHGREQDRNARRHGHRAIFSRYRQAL